MKTNHYFKIAALLLLFAFFGCQKEKDLNDEVLLSKEENFSIKESSFIEALENKDFKNTYLKYEDLKSKTIKGQSSKTDPELYNFKIDGANVKVVKIGAVTSYTIPVYRDIVSKDYFENLVLQTNSSKEVKAFLIKYTHDGSIVLIPEHDSFTMQGTYKTTLLDMNKIKLTALDGCYGSWQAMCSWGGTKHSAGQRCIDNNDDGRIFYEYVPGECETSYGDSGSGNYGSSGGGTPIDGNSSGIDEPLIVPTLPDGTVVNFEEDMARSLASKLKITNQAQINYLISNFNVVLQLDDFLLANDTPEGREFVKDFINAKTTDNFAVVFANPVFTQDPYSVWKSLSQAEKDLIKQYPNEAFSIFENREIAENETQARFGKNGLNDKSDAFRHAYYNVINAKIAGIDAAERFSIAHESEVPTSLLKEKEMDLFNNNIGHQIIISGNGSKTLSELAEIIYQKLLNGDLRYLSPIDLGDPNFSTNHGISTNTNLKPTNQ